MAVPRLRNKTLIPSGLTNYPKLNSGLFSIGKNPSGGAFVCQDIQIETGAELTIRVNNFLENYSLIDNAGSIYVLSQSPGAVLNGAGAQLILRSGGQMVCQ